VERPRAAVLIPHVAAVLTGLAVPGRSGPLNDD
jgi:hypothetical protein